MKDIVWLNEDSLTILNRGYLNGVTPQERIKRIGDRAEEILGIEGYSDKFCDYMARGWFSLSSPMWANFGVDRGLPISCNGSYVGDDLGKILYKVSEVGMMTKYGAGTSAYFGHLRGRGSKIKKGGTTSGSVHFMSLFDTVTTIVSQSNIRRGGFAGYLDIDHPDIMEFLDIREEGHFIQDISIGVCISDEWMNDLLAGKPANKKVWMRLLKKRYESGYPYIVFTGNANAQKPQVYKDLDMPILSSNLCTEIMLPQNEDESFVCCISSMNLYYYDDWKDTDAVEVMAMLLDASLTEYLEKIKDIPFMQAAYNFAERHRALGIGTLGWHSYLQKNMIPFESLKAKSLNIQFHKNISEKAEAASIKMAELFGEPELMKGRGKRNTTMMAIAPTTTSSAILGQISPSVEPLRDNYFVKDLEKGKFTYKNPELIKLLETKGKNTPSVWKNILQRGGSVQHLDFLSDHEKEVFKTFGEISQKEIIIQAAGRNPYIDQGQSINLMIHPATPPKEVSTLLIEAWKMGLKSLYYQRSTNPSQELSRSILTCASCES